MPSPVELTLFSLLPTISFLPPELIDLSTSLLAQSRAKAATLKPEEEIARTYACCHIACQRLGHKLSLEIARPAPPVKPRVYHKLHTYFNSVLATPKTPKRVAPAEPSAASNTSTPTSRKTLQNGHTIPAKGSTPATPSAKRAHKDVEDHLPSDTMPLIRQICKALDKPELAPHVFAGVQSLSSDSPILDTPRKRRKPSAASTDYRAVTEDSIPSLVVSVFCAAHDKAYGNDSDRKGDLRGKIIAAVEEYCSRNAHAFASHDREELSELPAGTDVPSAWLDMEWYQNIPSLQSSVNDFDQEPEDASDGVMLRTTRPAKTPLRRKEKHGKPDVNGDQDDPGPAGLLPGLGTMFQPAVDWLSRERQLQYAQWKRSISAQLAVLEQAA